MFNKKNRWPHTLVLGLSIFIGCAVLLSYAPLSYAGEGEERVKSRTLDPYQGYPETFNGRGILEVLHEGYAVISDSEYILSSGTIYNSPMQTNVSMSLYKKGQFVAFVKNEKGEIISLWQLNKLSDLMPK